MTAPTLVNSVQISTPWAQSANITAGLATEDYAATLTTSSGDLIIALQGSAEDTTGTLTTTSGISFTQQTEDHTASHCPLNIASATDGAGGTRTITLNRSATPTARVGGWALQFRSHGGVGNVLTATDGSLAGGVGISCSANSSLIVICLDWNAITGTRTWATINGNAPTLTAGVDGDGASWSAALAYWNDVGASGTKTLQLTAPTFTAPSYAAIEILGTAGSTLTQYGFRFRNDDGNESAATWIAGQNVNP